MAEERAECDVLVVGSGAGGLSAAIAADHAGLDVLVAEKEPVFGGTTARSAGVIWIPGSRQARDAGLADSREAALEYLQTEVGNRLDRAKAEAFLDNCVPMLEFLEANSHVRYVVNPLWADYHPDLPGASQGGRSLMVEAFDGRLLGDRFAELRPPLSTMMIFGGMMIGREDIPHVFAVLRSPASALHMGKLFARYVADRARHPRGTRISNGNALVARMVRTLMDRDVPLWVSSPVVELVRRDGRVAGAVLERGGKRIEVAARRGVVLACGGFPGDAALRRRLYPHVAAGQDHRSAAPETNTGDGVRLGMAAGGAFVEDAAHPAAWTPMSLVPQPGGGTVPFPHFIDRGKPGYIAVDRRGRRFCNEATSYHDFVPAMLEACRGDAAVEAWLLCDRRAIRRFGLGVCPPAPGRLGPHLRNGYVATGRTVGELAAAIGVDRAGLEATVADYNRHAARGEDPQFGRGGDAYQRFNGAPDNRPNPCVAPIERSPFYAVRLVPGDIGTFMGLRTDGRARVLDAAGAPVPGLWAAGNDMASVMGGHYPGAGITIGPALTFGYIAARDIAAAAP